MKTIVMGECAPELIYKMSDPDAPLEIDLEAATVKVLSCLYANYRCVVFTGGFQYEDRISRPDLALVAKDYSHWFVIEVELASHSLWNHVIPQVRAFQYGDPLLDCASILKRELGIDLSRARTLVEYVPRSVVVIANRRDHDWQTALASHGAQYGIVSMFKTAAGVEAIEFDGLLEVSESNLGFASYSAVDRSFRFPVKVDLPDGAIQISDPTGTPGTWLVSRDERWAWVTKQRGVPAIPDGSFVQLRRTFDGSISVKIPAGRMAR